MSVPEKIRNNFSYGKRKKENVNPFYLLFGIVFRVLGIAAFIALTGILFVFIHDYVNQSKYFTTEKIEVKGNRYLSKEDILSYGHVKKGMNLFSVNTFILEKKLENHLWIKDVEIKRDFPGKLIIKVKEYKGIAAVDIGRKYLIDAKGEPFKRFDKNENLSIPVVKGLTKDDILKGESRVFRSLLTLLGIIDTGRKEKYKISEIEVDSELGLTIISEKIKKIKVCFDNFISKFERAEKIIEFMERSEKKISSMDLCNINQVVVKQELPAVK